MNPVALPLHGGRHRGTDESIATLPGVTLVRNAVSSDDVLEAVKAYVNANPESKAASHHSYATHEDGKIPFARANVEMTWQTVRDTRPWTPGVEQIVTAVTASAKDHPHFEWAEAFGTRFARAQGPPRSESIFAHPIAVVAASAGVVQLVPRSGRSDAGGPRDVELAAGDILALGIEATTKFLYAFLPLRLGQPQACPSCASEKSITWFRGFVLRRADEALPLEEFQARCAKGLASSSARKTKRCASPRSGRNRSGHNLDSSVNESTGSSLNTSSLNTSSLDTSSLDTSDMKNSPAQAEVFTAPPSAKKFCVRSVS